MPTTEHHAMRILICADFLPPMSGGLEQHAYREAIELRRRGHIVRAVALTDGVSGTAVDPDLSIVRVDGWRAATRRFASDPDRVFHPPLPDPGVVRTLQKIIEEFRPDIIHAHGWIEMSVLRASSDVPVVVTLHDQGAICAKRSLLDADGQPCAGPTLSRCMSCASAHYGKPIGTAMAVAMTRAPHRLSRAAKIFAVSNQVRDAVLAASALPQSQIEVIENFFDEETVAKAAFDPRPDWLPEGPTVLAIGAVSRFKGAPLLVEAWPGVRAEVSRRSASTNPSDDAPQLVFIGPTTDETPHNLGEGVVTVGSRPHREVLAAMRHARAVAVVSIGPDACPTTAMESMASGCPVVVSNLGGAVDIVVDGLTGRVIDPAQPSQLTDAVISVFTDTAATQRMADAARRAVRQRTTPSIVDRIEATCKAIVRQRTEPDHLDPSPAQQRALDELTNHPIYATPGSNR